jgi:hypothetical protein
VAKERTRAKNKERTRAKNKVAKERTRAKNKERTRINESKLKVWFCIYVNNEYKRRV